MCFFFIYKKKVKGLITEHNLQDINIMHLFTPSSTPQCVIWNKKIFFSILK